MRRRPETNALPTARTTLRTGYARVLVFCNSCRHQADADLQAIVDAGRGDVPLTQCFPGGTARPRGAAGDGRAMLTRRRDALA
jgi:hypothetical protein